MWRAVSSIMRIRVHRKLTGPEPNERTAATAPRESNTLPPRDCERRHSNRVRAVPSPYRKTGKPKCRVWDTDEGAHITCGVLGALGQRAEEAELATLSRGDRSVRRVVDLGADNTAVLNPTDP